jgi:hypothetical protein
METTVGVSEMANQGLVRHQTFIRKFGVTLFRSREEFSLNTNGLDLEITGERQSMPLLITEAYGESSGRVAPDAKSARYIFPWFGTVINQTVVIESEGHVSVTMETPWLRGDVLLSRISTVD